jgi:hypothetical protein
LNINVDKCITNVIFSSPCCHVYLKFVDLLWVIPDLCQHLVYIPSTGRATDEYTIGKNLEKSGRDLFDEMYQNICTVTEDNLAKSQSVQPGPDPMTRINIF